MAWADAFAFGTPTRFGAPAAQLKQFIDQAGRLWREGKLADKPVTAFTSAFNRHGGSEATILSLGNVFYQGRRLAEITIRLLDGGDTATGHGTMAGAASQTAA